MVEPAVDRERILILGAGESARLAKAILDGPFQVLVARSLEPSLETPPPDLVLLELVGADERRAADTCARLKESWPAVPVLVLMPSPSFGLKRRVFDSGASDCVDVPFVTHELLARVNAHLALGGSGASRGPRSTQELCEAIVRDVGTGILVIDLGQKVVFGNHYALERAGLTDAEFRGMSLRDLCPALAARMEQGEITRGCFSGELPWQFRTKQSPVEFCVYPLKGRGGFSGGHIMLFTDLTDIDQLCRSVRSREQVKAMEDAALAVAHQVRNPLFAVTAAAQLLSKELSLRDEQAELMRVILLEARRLDRTVQELVDFARMRELNLSWFDVNSVIAETSEMVARLGETRGVRIACDLGDEVRVQADRDQVRQLVSTQQDRQTHPYPHLFSAKYSVCGSKMGESPHFYFPRTSYPDS